MKGRRIFWLADLDDWQGYWYVEHKGQNDGGKLNCYADFVRLAKQYPGLPFLCLIPGEQCRTTTAKLPGRRKTALKTLSHQFADSVLAPIEQLVFTPFAQSPINPKEWEIMICEHQWLARWQGKLAECPLKIKRLLPDYLAVPPPEKGTRGLLWNGRLLVRGGLMAFIHCRRGE